MTNTAPGHDAKLKSHLIKWDVAGLDISRNEGGVDLSGLAEVIAKIGRWEYKGIEKDGTFYYLAKDGHTRKEATKYQVVRAV